MLSGIDKYNAFRSVSKRHKFSDGTASSSVVAANAVEIARNAEKSTNLMKTNIFAKIWENECIKQKSS